MTLQIVNSRVKFLTTYDDEAEIFFAQTWFHVEKHFEYGAESKRHNILSFEKKPSLQK